MVFSTPIFLFYFLALTLLVYYLVPRKLRNGVLLLSSLFFYYWGEQLYVSIMFLSTAIDYVHGLLVERCKARDNDRGARMAVASSIVFNLALLLFFKYWDFLAGSLQAVGLTFMPVLNIHLPIGISFYTFQTMSYTIDVYRDDAKVQRSLVNFGTFVTLFPQLIAGPIIKYKDLGDQIDHRTHSPEQFASGVQIFVVGLAKKVLLANNIGKLWDTILALPAGELTTAGAWLGVAAFAFQLYFDFSGYSDMAVGLGRMLGFEFMRNFNYPYIAKSVTEFWRRWHISLGTWFREYLYIPLGGNRGGTARTIRNLLIVWFCTGFWHGASWNFILWGLYFAAWLILERYVLRGVLEKTPAILKHLYTLIVVFVGWGLFAMVDLGVCGDYLAACFGGAPLWSGADLFRLRSYAVTLAVLVLASTALGQRLWAKLPRQAEQLATPVLMGLSLVVCTAYLVDGSYNPFLYFRF
mgnify:CR=1 FL=1